MEEKIYKILKAGRSINPSEEFKTRSRRLIVTTPQNQPGIFYTIRNELLENFGFGLALGLASLLIFVILGGFSYFKTSFAPENITLIGEELIAEVENLDFQIQLGAAKYFEESAEEIAALLKEIEEADGKN